MSGATGCQPGKASHHPTVPLSMQRTIPPSEATPTPLIPHPGITIHGTSYVAGPDSERTLPTVFAPFHAGTVFRVEDPPTPQGTTLHFSNMTLLMPNVTFNGIYESGFLEFFDIGDTAIICFTNRCDPAQLCSWRLFTNDLHRCPPPPRRPFPLNLSARCGSARVRWVRKCVYA